MKLPIRSSGLAAGMILGLATLLAGAAQAQCPQYRETTAAPEAIREQVNPVAVNGRNLRAGKRLYLGKEGNTACYKCHGKKGDGKGPLARSFAPPPRNFACAETMNAIPDGQLFWIIRQGAPKSSMPAHPQLSDEQIWQLVLVLREMARAR